MRLRALDGSIDHALTSPLAPFPFPGDIALDATLVAGACSDFNVMTRRGRYRGDVSVHRSSAELAADAHITLLLCCAGRWKVGVETLEPEQALLWRAPPSAIVIRTDDDDAALLCVRLSHDHPDRGGLATMVQVV
jgi:environmental stress-induced protein Ves